MANPIDKDNADDTLLVDKVDHTKADYVPWKNRKRPPGSQVGRYKRFDKSIPNGAERVFEPRKYDVVFGRGKGSHDHPGNKRMRDIIRRHKRDYAAIHRSKKRQIAELVYSEITRDGARFLHKIKDEDAYAVVDLNLALQKLSNTLRCRKSCLIDDDEEDNEATANSSSIVTPGSVTSASIEAAAAGIKALKHPVGVGQLPHAGLLPPASLLQSLESGASDPLLPQRLFGGLTSRADLLVPPTGLAEREILLRRSSLPSLGGCLLGSTLLSAEPVLSSASCLPSTKLRALLLAEREFLMARSRLRSAALGL